MTFGEAARLVTSGAGDSTWQVPDGWQQGRGTFGGLTLAVLARAAAASLDGPGRALRTLTGEIPGAIVPGPASVKVTPLRSGHALSTIAAHVVQGGGVVAHAVMNFGETRDVGFDRGPRAPPPRAYEDCPPTGLGPVGPVFTKHIEYRVTRGAPLEGRAAETEGWVRLLDPGDVSAEVALVALVDAWFPSILPALPAPRPFGTISFAAHLFDRGWRPDEPLHHRSRLLASHQGYFAELRELHTAKGELAAVNQQTMAIIK